MTKINKKSLDKQEKLIYNTRNKGLDEEGLNKSDLQRDSVWCELSVMMFNAVASEPGGRKLI